ALLAVGLRRRGAVVRAAGLAVLGPVALGLGADDQRERLARLAVELRPGLARRGLHLLRAVALAGGAQAAELRRDGRGVVVVAAGRLGSLRCRELLRRAATLRRTGPEEVRAVARGDPSLGREGGRPAETRE